MKESVAASKHEISMSLPVEFQLELGTTRTVFERVPEQQLAWLPHERSLTIGQLALLTKTRNHMKFQGRKGNGLR